MKAPRFFPIWLQRVESSSIISYFFGLTILCIDEGKIEVHQHKIND